MASMPSAQGRIASPQGPPSAGKTPVRVDRDADGFHLRRNGDEVVIHGADGVSSLDRLAAIGGNSIRTYGVEGTEQVLDQAHGVGLTVTAGLWLGHQSYLDYAKDTAALERQREMVRAAAERFKDHPALLMWGLGNEMETGGAPDNPALWREVERLARLIKSIDPNHPVMTVVAEISPEKIAAIKKYAPSVDVLGVNSYGGAFSLHKRLKKAGWDRPYVLTEFGPLGPWESAKTPWGAPLEPSSTEKADVYRRAWRANQNRDSLGGYAFQWGHKYEATETWFGMLEPATGERLAAVDAMQEAFTRRGPANRVPVLDSLKSSASGQRVPPGSVHPVRVAAHDPEGDGLGYRWEVRPESGPAVGGAVRGQGAQVDLVAPSQEGAYRLYTFVSDGHGGAATANFPFYVGR
jgi:hypothetical protein